MVGVRIILKVAKQWAVLVQIYEVEKNILNGGAWIVEKEKFELISIVADRIRLITSGNHG